jgi:DNA-binding NarL/FixJ family response regulator
LESPFSALFRSISVLFVDDDPGQLQLYKDSLNEHPLYTVVTAGTAEEAQRILLGGVTIHLCVLDMGINDIRNDEFFLIKKFKDRCPFIVISGSMDIEKAYKATTYGAAGMISKPVETHTGKFWNTLTEVFCSKAIIPQLPENANSQLKLCCEVLRNNKPGSVTEWAAHVNISDSYLRKLWGECFTISPKLMLLKYKVYQKAFLYHNAMYLAETNDASLPVQFAKRFGSLYLRPSNY